MRLDGLELLNIEHLHGKNIETLHGKRLRGVSTDSRTVKAGDVFFAIRGDKFDGHSFLSEAFSRGCTAAVVEEGSVLGTSGVERFPLVFVRNSVQALGQFARFYRRKFDIPVIAITGSNGKTTTREMIAGVLAEKFMTLKTESNLNNHIGVPQTLFCLEKEHDVAVIEMGTNHFGEIDYLCTVAEPTHGLVTNIARAHLEFFGSLEGAAKAKGELFDWLGSRGIGFVNGDDPLVVQEAKRLRNKFTYGFEGKRVNVKGRFLGLSKEVQPRFSFGGHPLSKPCSVELRTIGSHSAENALAAAAVGLKFGISGRRIKSALEKYRPFSKRMEALKAYGVSILNDTYNANPDSVLGALRTLASMQCEGKKIVVLGDMLELGEASEWEHRNIGREIAGLGFEYVLTYGQESGVIASESNAVYALHYNEKSALIAYLDGLVAPGDIVLVKGSGGTKMEEVVIHLIEHLRGRE